MMIKTENLCKTYKSGVVGRQALHNINLQVETGEMLAITGPSGSGKSSLLHILGCLDKATSGHYYLEGDDISNFNAGELAWIRNHKIGFVFQDFDLLEHLTALENVRLPMIYGGVPDSLSFERASDLLDQMGLSQKSHLYPGQLSGGQQQRIAIARALSMNPKLILADEPTGNLDSENASRILKILTTLNKEQKVTVLIITHDHDIAEKTGRIIEIRDGMLETRI